MIITTIQICVIEVSMLIGTFNLTSCSISPCKNALWPDQFSLIHIRLLDHCHTVLFNLRMQRGILWHASHGRQVIYAALSGFFPFQKLSLSSHARFHMRICISMIYCFFRIGQPIYSFDYDDKRRFRAFLYSVGFGEAFDNQ